MSNSDRPIFHLSLETSEPGLEVMVIDAEGSVVGRGSGNQRQLDLDLPRGLYTIRSIRSSAYAERILRLDGSQRVKVVPPQVFSAAVIPGASTTHEYYTWPAWFASQTPTAPDKAWNGPVDASLLLFVRAARKEFYGADNQLATLSLRTIDGRTLSEFRGEVKQHPDGWAAFSARLSHGLLILEDSGERPRQIPVPLMPGWQTQIFLMYSKRLLWEDMRLATLQIDVIESRKSRSPYDLNQNPEDIPELQNMDAGLLALQNDTPSVAPQLIHTFLSSKFQNPIVGLLGAYLMLLCMRRDVKNSDYPPGLIRDVIDNLNGLLSESPDVVALRLMAEPWLGTPALSPVVNVPLFRCGAEALLQAAASNPELLPEGSLLDAISDSLYGDTVWTTWKPAVLPLNEGRIQELNEDSLSWVELAMVDAISVAELRGKGLEADDLIRQIGVSPRTVRNAMSHLITNTATKRLKDDTGHSNMRVLGGKAVPTLASSLGLKVDQNLLTQIAGKPDFDENATMPPSIHQVYAPIKKALYEVVDKQVGKISADSMLKEIVSPNDVMGRTLLGKRLSRQFNKRTIALTNKELSEAESVRDLAHLIICKLSK